MEHATNSGGYWFFRFNVDASTQISTGGGSAESPDWGWSAGWHHIAVTRESTNLRMWLDGVLKDTFDIGTTAMNTNTDDVSFGGYAGANYSTTGYMDDMRISDIARYTDTDGFTALTSAFVSDANTLVLIHADNSRNKGAGQIADSSTGNVLSFSGNSSGQGSKYINFSVTLAWAENAGVTYDEMVEHTAKKTSIRRIGQPGEIASAVAFLASGAASYINGADFSIDGGRFGV
jgi:hypothetical protein